MEYRIQIKDQNRVKLVLAQHPARARRLPHRVPPALPQLHDGGEPAARQEAEEGKQVRQLHHCAIHTGKITTL